jgi:hypothetical protein
MAREEKNWRLAVTSSIRRRALDFAAISPTADAGY